MNYSPNLQNDDRGVSLAEPRATLSATISQPSASRISAAIVDAPTHGLSDGAFERAVIRGIHAIEEVIAKRPMPKAPQLPPPTSLISTEIAAGLIGQSMAFVHSLIRGRSIRGNLYTRTVSLSSLMAWKGLQDEKKRAA